MPSAQRIYATAVSTFSAFSSLTSSGDSFAWAFFLFSSLRYSFWCFTPTSSMHMTTASSGTYSNALIISGTVMLIPTSWSELYVSISWPILAAYSARSSSLWSGFGLITLSGSLELSSSWPVSALNPYCERIVFRFSL